jgi:hypothetical protein
VYSGFDVELGVCVLLWPAGVGCVAKGARFKSEEAADAFVAYVMNRSDKSASFEVVRRGRDVVPSRKCRGGDIFFFYQAVKDYGATSKHHSDLGWLFRT